MDAVILDRFGRPYQTTAQDWYKGPGDSAFRVNAPRLDYDIRSMLSEHKHRVMISDGRNIVKSYSALAGAVSQKADMVSTNLWEPVFEGDDQDWGEQAENALARHLISCDVKGATLRFANAYRIASWLLDVDGDLFRVKVIDKKTGLPKVQSFEAHRVGSPSTARLFNPAWFRDFDSETRAFASSLDGATVQSGIVTGEYGEELAIIITDGTYRYNPVGLIPASRYWHITEPEWYSELRGMPKVIYAIYDWYDLKETREAEKIKQKVQSKLSVTEDNSTGYSPARPTAGVAKSNGVPDVHPLENGMIRFFKSGSGNKLQFLNSNTPGDSWQRFQQAIEQGAFYALNWNRALLDPSGLSSANMHSVAEQINFSIFKRFDNLEFFARQELQWYVSGLIGVGRIPNNPEWYKWTVAQPPEYQVNQSRNNAATIESLRAGTETHPRIIRAKGGRPLKWLREEAKFLKQARELAEKEGLPFEMLVQTGKPGDPTNATQDLQPESEPQEREQ